MAGASGIGRQPQKLATVERFVAHGMAESGCIGFIRPLSRKE
jgi:hypothetical protein